MQKLQRLGDYWEPGVDPEESYTGDSGSSMTGIQYYRNKAREFQEVLNAVDIASGSLAASIYELDAYSVAQAATGQDPTATEMLDAELYSLLDEYESKKTVFRATAEAINLGASGINALGGRFPELSIPTGLGAPIIVPVAMIAAIGVAAGLIVWGNTWLSSVGDRMEIAVQAGLISDPVARDAFVARIGEIKAQAAAASGSGLSNIASMVKWGAIGLGLLLAYQAFQSHQANRSIEA